MTSKHRLIDTIHSIQCCYNARAKNPLLKRSCKCHHFLILFEKYTSIHAYNAVQRILLLVRMIYNIISNISILKNAAVFLYFYTTTSHLFPFTANFSNLDFQKKILGRVDDGNRSGIPFSYFLVHIFSIRPRHDVLSKKF